MSEKKTFKFGVPTPAGNKLFISALKKESKIVALDDTITFKNIQKVVKVGEHILNMNKVADFKLEEGDVVAIDLDHRSFKKAIRNKTEAERFGQETTIDSQMDVKVENNIDICVFDDVEYALIDKEAILWTWKADKVDEVMSGVTMSDFKKTN